jgi:serpin B
LASNCSQKYSNATWASEDATFKPEFTQICQDLYRAQVLNLDFADPQAPSIINRWVNETTNGKIDQIIEEIQSLSILFIINALYFKGDWTVQFDRAHTREGLFTLSDGGQKRIQMMSQSGHYPYYRGKDFQAVSLPYGQGRLSMYIFLPDRDSSLAKFMESLASEKWEWWLSNLQKTKGDVALPRFRLEYELDLNDALKALGMEKAFNQVGADFGGMCPIPPSPNIYISKVLHKTFIEVNEEGTEAAAVTSVEMAKLAMVETFTIEVDRPFFCAIRDNQTGTVLFIGSITEPYREAN